MNKDRRKQIASVVKRLQEELSNLVDDFKSEIESIRDDEQEYLDAMPDNFRYGEKGELAEAAVSELDEALSALEELDVDSIVANLETAAE